MKDEKLARSANTLEAFAEVATSARSHGDQPCCVYLRWSRFNGGHCAALCVAMVVYRVSTRLTRVWRTARSVVFERESGERWCVFTFVILENKAHIR